MKNIAYSNKAITLEKLRSQGMPIPKLKIFYYKKFLKNSSHIIKIIQKNFNTVAVRSSAHDEDSKKYSSCLYGMVSILEKKNEPK